ncbi:MAG: carbon-nitrogen hydrolase family protein [Thermoflexales bacterium]
MDALTTPAPSELLTGVVDSRAALPVAEPLAVRVTRMSAGVRVAAAQFSPSLGDVGGNLARIDRLMTEAARNGASLIVFPECAITGHYFADRATAIASALLEDDDAIQSLVHRCRTQHVECVVGALVRSGDHLMNAAFLLGPAGVIGRYDKAHLPFFGADKFTNPGHSGFRVFQAAAGKVGILIGYDLSFPEAARRLALAGAEIIALPTAWPGGAESEPDYQARARANENHVFLIACNRVGAERGAQFIGRSCIIGPDGRHLADASPYEEHIIIAEIEPTQARNKKIIVEPGEFEMDTFADRRPDLYG